MNEVARPALCYSWGVTGAAEWRARGDNGTNGVGHMDVMDWIPMVRRHRALALGLLVLTLAGAVALVLRPGPYRAQSQVGFLPSRASAKAYGGNPYLGFTQSVSVTADLVRRELMAPQTAARLAAAGFSSSYLVIDDVDPSAPVLDITVTGSSASQVEQTLTAVTRAAASKLAAVQARLRPSDRMATVTLSADPRPTLSLSHKARDLVIVLGAGLFLTAAAVGAADAVTARRRGYADGGPDEPGVAGRQHAEPPAQLQSR